MKQWQLRILLALALIVVSGCAKKCTNSLLCVTKYSVAPKHKKYTKKQMDDWMNVQCKYNSHQAFWIDGKLWECPHYGKSSSDVPSPEMQRGY